MDEPSHNGASFGLEIRHFVSICSSVEYLYSNTVRVSVSDPLLQKSTIHYETFDLLLPSLYVRSNAVCHESY